jgi:UDP-N-acetylmuramoyl-L-alanyl-D-glutamate--2,6-diaminopimelate ligase
VTLRQLLEDVDVVAVSGDMDMSVTGVCPDSRRVRPGDVFFGLSGLKQDGQAFVRQALTAGASAAVVGRDIHYPGATLVQVDEPRKALAQASARFFGSPSRALEVVGVTGTNGKTTVTWMLESVFRAAGRPSGVIGTTGVRYAGRERASAFTTPEAPELQGLLREMVDARVRAVAIEVSSHALAQRRSFGLECDVVVFTNLSHDHLDYHGSMEAYLDAKLMLFDGRNGATEKRTVAVVNADDPHAARVASAAKSSGMPILGCSGMPSTKSDAQLRVEDLELLPGGLEIGFLSPERHPDSPRAFLESSRHGKRHVRLPLLGRYNAINAALAYGASLALGIDHQTIVRGLESMPAVPGRLERVEAGQPFTVVVDYAHTPDALERSLAAAREHAHGRVLLVFGCGGDRDRAKRPVMGRIAAMGAELAWVTSDNPRSEPPERIASEILAGAPGAGLRLELDRRAAIAAALREARPDDLVLIAGKGHETTQTIGERVLPFDDREVARERLRSRSGAGR